MEPIYYQGRKLRVAKELPKKVLDTIAMQLIKKLPDGTLEMPTHDDISLYLDGLAEEHKVDHFILNGEYGKLTLFDSETVLDALRIIEVKAKHHTSVVKIQCYDDPVTAKDKIPKEIESIKELFKVPDVIYNAGSCVYFLCKDDRVVYVGKSVNIQSRLQQHLKEKEFDKVYYIRVSPSQLDTVESALIAMLRPVLNKTNQSLCDNRRLIASQMLGIEQIVN